MKRHEILENRKKWIKFLQDPKRRKTTERLDKGKGYRCLLGHGCYILGVERSRIDNLWAYGLRKNFVFAPSEFISLVGLSNQSGIFNTDDGESTLTILNDETDMTPQEMGDYLESVIEGGDNTPFKPLTDYEE